MREIRGLSVIQPWATLLVIPEEHRKRFETRGYDTKYRGVVAVHASKNWTAAAQDFASTERALGRLPSRVALGAIVGLVEIIATYRTEEVAGDISALERLYGDYSYGRWAWETELLCTFDKPIGCKGALGLWKLPDAVLSQVVAMAERVGVSLSIPTVGKR